MREQHRHLANKCEDTVNLQEAEAYCVASRHAHSLLIWQSASRWNCRQRYLVELTAVFLMYSRAWMRMVLRFRQHISETCLPRESLVLVLSTKPEQPSDKTLEKHKRSEHIKVAPALQRRRNL